MRYVWHAALVCVLVGHVLSDVPTVASAQSKCDRACLTDTMTRYLNAMVAHDPAALPVAPNVKFTEDGKVLKLGEGVWKTVAKLRPYRLDFIDVPQGIAAVHTVLEEILGAATALQVRDEAGIDEAADVDDGTAARVCDGADVECGDRLRGRNLLG